MNYKGPEAFRKAVAELSRLPGIGEKTAMRLALHLVRSKDEVVAGLSEALADVKRKITLCPSCFNLAEGGLCVICSDTHRDEALVCVVEEPCDLIAIEQAGHFRGRYHVLHGSLAPLDGVGPEDLRIGELLQRADAGKIREIVLATNPDVEGEATALYLAKLFSARRIKVSRIAMGIPMGGHLEFADQVTLARAIAERRDFSAG